MTNANNNYYDGCPSIAAATADHNAYLARNLDLVARGIKARAAGIRRCRDCTEPFIVGVPAYWWCENCRIDHTVKCRSCQERYRIDGDASGLCPLHRDHPTLDLGGLS